MALATRFGVLLGALSAASAFQCNGTFTVSSFDDVAKANACEVFDGTISISPAFGRGDSVNVTSIDFSGIGEINGDLVCENNPRIGSISSRTLRRISGNLTLNAATKLSRLDFPLLETASLSWCQLSDPLVASFPRLVNASIVRIHNSTFQNLTSLNVQYVDHVEVIYNSKMELIELSALARADGDVWLVGGDGQSNNISLPRLEVADGKLSLFAFENVYMPKLRSVADWLLFVNLTGDTIEAPALQEVGALRVRISSVSHISFPSLTRAGLSYQEGGGIGFEVVENFQLKALQGLPSLEVLNSNTLIQGQINNVSLPSLREVDQYTIATTSNDGSVCRFFERVAGPNATSSTCTWTKPGLGSVLPSTHGNGTEKTKMILAIVLPFIAVVIVLNFLALCYIRVKMATKHTICRNATNIQAGLEKFELPPGDQARCPELPIAHRRPSELDVCPIWRPELRGSLCPIELDGKPFHELPCVQQAFIRNNRCEAPKHP